MCGVRYASAVTVKPRGTALTIGITCVGVCARARVCECLLRHCPCIGITSDESDTFSYPISLAMAATACSCRTNAYLRKPGVGSGKPGVGLWKPGVGPWKPSLDRTRIEFVSTGSGSRAWEYREDGGGTVIRSRTNAAE
jgi:hypothetical protein